jgi:hypothetical protein
MPSLNVKIANKKLIFTQKIIAKKIRALEKIDSRSSDL